MAFLFVAERIPRRFKDNKLKISIILTIVTLLPNLEMTTGTQEIHKLTTKGIIAQHTVKKHKTFNTNNNRI